MVAVCTSGTSPIRTAAARPVCGSVPNSVRAAGAACAQSSRQTARAITTWSFMEKFSVPPGHHARVALGVRRIEFRATAISELKLDAGGPKQPHHECLAAEFPGLAAVIHVSLVRRDVDEIDEELNVPRELHL